MIERSSGNTAGRFRQRPIASGTAVGDGGSPNPLRWVLFAAGGAAFGIACLSWFMHGPGDPHGLRVGCVAGALLGMTLGVPCQAAWNHAAANHWHRRTYSLRTLFAVTTLAACCLGAYQGLTRNFFILLGIAAIPCAPTVVILLGCAFDAIAAVFRKKKTTSRALSTNFEIDATGLQQADDAQQACGSSFEAENSA